MVENRSPDRPACETIDVDVLILGGGVQGLWLLNDLVERGYTALLLEIGKLGGKQTCHSHVYIHQGYVYREADLAERLRVVNTKWESWLGKHQPKREGEPCLFGFQNSADLTPQMALWDTIGLRYSSADLPSVLEDGNIRVVLQTPEICLNAESLVTQLIREVRGHISQVIGVDDIRVDAAGKRVESLEVTVSPEARLRLQPRALVLAAGMGNQQLLNLLASRDVILQTKVNGAQQVRMAHMLVIEGAEEALPPLSGVFEPNGLFIVSRRLRQKVVWLVSDRRNQLITADLEDGSIGAKPWIPEMVTALKIMAPRYFGDRERTRLKWGVYDAPKAEGSQPGGGLPSEEKIAQFGLENLWTVWPTKLTLAPLAAEKVVDQIKRAGIRPPRRRRFLPPLWSESRVEADVASELWTGTNLLPWDEFDQCYDIDKTRARWLSGWRRRGR